MPCSSYGRGRPAKGAYRSAKKEKARRAKEAARSRRRRAANKKH